MLRLASPDGVRLASSRTLDATFGGGEANVAISLARLGVDAAFVTALPDNDLGDAARHFLAGHGVDVAGIISRPGRLGIYFLEPGAAQRPSRVLYDRSESSFAQAGPGDFAWDPLLAGATWFHTTGITPALSASAAEAAIAGAQGSACRRRDRLGRPELPRQAVEVGQARRRRDGRSRGRGGRPDRQRRGRRQGLRDPRVRAVPSRMAQVDAAGYAAVATQLAERFPRLHTIAFTQRGSISASENTWSGVSWTPRWLPRRPLLPDRADRRPGRCRRRVRGGPDLRDPRRACARRRARVRRGGELPEAHHPRRCQPGQRGRGRRAGAADPGRDGSSDDPLGAPRGRSIAIVETGVLPLFYSDDADRASRITAALREGGARAIEFTDRGPGAWSVFSTLAGTRRLATTRTPSSAPDRSATPYAADRFIAAGARFIVGPSFDAEVARLCNRRRIPYLPGCATPTEIVTAEESGVELVKVFPGDSLGAGVRPRDPRPAPGDAGRRDRRRGCDRGQRRSSGSAPAPPASGSGRPSSAAPTPAPIGAADPADLTPAVARLIALVAAARAGGRIPRSRQGVPLVTQAIAARDYQNLIDGRWVDAADGRTSERMSPAHDVVVGRYPAGGAEDLDRAVAAARKAFDDGPWPTMPGVERARVLNRVAEAIRADADDLAYVEALESRQADHARRATRSSRRPTCGSTRRPCAATPTATPTTPSAPSMFGLVLREPVGRRGHDHALELPAADHQPEAPVRPGRRLHGRRQACRADARAPRSASPRWPRRPGSRKAS